MLKRNKTPQFCIITPTAYLEQYASRSSMHLILAHLVDVDETYASFYRNRTEYKIMDNGAFELGESYDPNKLIDLANKCKADAIVLPDYPGKPWWETVGAAEDLLPKVKDAGFHTFFCPQSKIGDWKGWLRGYRWAADKKDVDIIGYSILSLPNALPHISPSFVRVVATRMLIESGDFAFHKYNHYLGLVNASLELPSLILMGALDSCDSSNPVWAGINGFTYNTTQDGYLPISKKYLREVDFNYPLVNKPHICQIIQHNIDIIKDIFENPVSHL